MYKYAFAKNLNIRTWKQSRVSNKTDVDRMKTLYILVIFNLSSQNPICETNKPSLKILHVDRKTNELCHYHICDVMVKTNYKTTRKVCIKNYQTIEKHRPQRLNQSCLQDLYAIAKTMELILVQFKVASSLHLPQCRHSTVSQPLFWLQVLASLQLQHSHRHGFSGSSLLHDASKYLFYQ